MSTFSKSDLFKVPFTQMVIEEGLNIRTDMGDLSVLAESIYQSGIKVPLGGYKKGDSFVVIHGHRRHAAMQMIYDKYGVDIVAPVTVEKKGTNDEERIIDMVLTNEGKALTALEKAEAVRRLLAYNWKESEIARRLGYSGAYINRLNLLNKAPEALREYVRAGRVSATLAMDIVKNNETERILQQLDEGGTVEENTANADGETLKPLSSTPKKITNKDIKEPTINSWKEFRQAAVFIDHKKIEDPAKKSTFSFLLKLLNDELTQDQITRYFKLIKD